MSQIIQRIESAKVINALDTYIHTTLTNSIYTISLSLTEHPVSGVITTLQHNGITVASTSTPTAQNSASTTGAGSGPLTAPTQLNDGQEVVQLSASVNCAISDTLSAIVTSAVAHDTKPNEIKGILNIRQGII